MKKKVFIIMGTDEVNMNVCGGKGPPSKPVLESRKTEELSFKW